MVLFCVFEDSKFASLHQEDNECWNVKAELGGISCCQCLDGV
uniref:Uncharacterized protein n=1 Tax=Arundo donax TaxID=35708 RepID=A0A0A9B0B0_ARUDO